MAMIVFVAAMNTLQLERATYWRRHTFDVILAAQRFEENLLDLQRGARGYFGLGDTNALESYHEIRKGIPKMSDQLMRLTQDNPEQQQRLKTLAPEMGALLAFDEKLIALRNKDGDRTLQSPALIAEGRKRFGAVRTAIRMFSEHEQVLLVQRDSAEQSESTRSHRLLIFGSVVAAMLLVVAHMLTNRELRHRKRVEAVLREISLLQKAIVNSADYAIVALEPNGVVRTFNAAAQRMLGYAPAEVIGKETPLLWRDRSEVEEHAKAISQDMGRRIAPDINSLLARSDPDRAVEYEATFVRKDGSRFPAYVSLTTLQSDQGTVSGFLGIIADITVRKRNEAEREQMIANLQSALAKIRKLSGMIPICGWCKSVRSDAGYWQSVEHYVRDHTDATLSHGVCPTCADKVLAEMVE